ASDEMNGRKPFTAGIDSSASFIAREFKKAGLVGLNGGGEFLQNFHVQTSEMLHSSVKINSRKIDQNDLLAFASSESFSWDNVKDSVATKFLKAGENFVDAMIRAAQEKKDMLLVADTSFRGLLKRFRSFQMQRFNGSGNILVALFPSPPKAYKVEVASK